MRAFLVSLLLVVCSIAPCASLAGGGGPLMAPRYALYADFDNKTVGDPIGIRGASFGEPVSLDGLDASVVAIAPGDNRLRLGNQLLNNYARYLRWRSIGDAEFTEGEVQISFDLTPTDLDGYSVKIRETGSAAKNFLSLVFNQAGIIHASDAAGSITTTASYAADATLHFELVFDMDMRTSSASINGSTMFSGRAFGIADRGIGTLYIGYDSMTTGSPLDVDNVLISGSLPFPVALEADFEDKAAGAPIGMGGAAVHEPISKSASMDAIVKQAGLAVRYLDISSSNTSGSPALRWQFLDNLEVRSGIYVLDFDMQMSTRDIYRVSLRERTSSAQSFMNLQFVSDGTMSVSDADGTVFLLGVSYDAGRVYQYRIVHDLDAGIYSIFRDGIPLIRERAHGITERGIGSILYSIGNGAQTSAHLMIDSLRVSLSKGAQISSDLEFLQEASTAMQNQPVVPVFQVGVVNILGEPVPDGTPVTLQIAPGTGPGGAALGGASATTTGGVATFPALTFDMPGTYRLVAHSFEAITLNSGNIVVEPSDVLFADGFDGIVSP